MGEECSMDEVVLVVGHSGLGVNDDGWADWWSTNDDWMR